MIIAILAGMLLPALSKTRERAQGVSCMNNLKNFGYAFNNYTDAANDSFLVGDPSMTVSWVYNNGNMWDSYFEQMNPYPYFKAMVPLTTLCPKVRNYANLKFTPKTFGGTMPYYVLAGFYEFNSEPAPDWISHGMPRAEFKVGSGSTVNAYIHRPLKVKGPSRKILQTEVNNRSAAANSNIGWWYLNQKAANLTVASGVQVEYAHNNLANTLLFDLHVEAKSFNTLYYSDQLKKNWHPYEN